MRPSVAELLARLETTYNEVILPEVGSEYAKTRAVVLSGIINHLRSRWAREAIVLWEHNRDLSEFLGEAADRLEGHAVAELADMAREIGAALAEATGGDERLTVDALYGRYVRLMELMDGLVVRLDRAQAETNASELRELRGKLRAALRRAIDRDLPLVSPPPHGGRGSEVGLDAPLAG